MKPTIDPHPWKLTESSWNPEHQILSESLFALGNGRMGQRANNEEGFSGKHLQGTYIAGVYYPDKTKVGWWKNGYPEYFAKVLNAVNFIGIHVRVNGEALDLATAKQVSHFHRELDMHQGLLRRTFTATLANGLSVRVEAERFLSIVDDEVAAISYKVTVEDAATVEVVPYLDFNVVNSDANWEETFWAQQAHASTPGQGHVHAKTKKLDFHVAAAMHCQVSAEGQALTGPPLPVARAMRKAATAPRCRLASPFTS